MARGIHLTLLIGPAVPVPAPPEVLDALTGVEVTTRDAQASGFQLSFTLDRNSPLQTLFLLAGGSPAPIMRVVIAVTVNGVPDVLMDGVVTNYETAPGSGAGHSTLTLTGEDLTATMDRLDFSGLPYPAMPAEGRVLLILAKYAVLGIVPMVIPSIMVDVPIPTSLIPAHRGTDLAYIRELADKAGYVFYLDPAPCPARVSPIGVPKSRPAVPNRR